MTCPVSAFRLKNILHGEHVIAPKFEYKAKAPQILHWWNGFFDLDLLSTIENSVEDIFYCEKTLDK